MVQAKDATSPANSIIAGRALDGHTAAVLLADENGLIVDRIAVEADVPALAERLAALTRHPAKP